MPRPPARPAIPASFVAKKAEILALLERSEEAYTDNSPKGTVDVQIQDLIAEINAYDGLVTTSSCAGRVAVFVEGPKPMVQTTAGEKLSVPKTSPGGKGGGRWLYVSHDPVPLLPTEDGATSIGSQEGTERYFTDLFSLSSSSSLPRSHHQDPSAAYQSEESSSRGKLESQSQSQSQAGQRGVPPSPRLIHLSFSPLILHILCATLHHARPLLAAAINAGFRESGLQSLRIMDDTEHGTMVAVRTAGLAFETVVGVLVEDANAEEAIHTLVGEEYLALCAGVVNERFVWNTERRERFKMEVRKAMEREGLAGPPSSASTVETSETGTGSGTSAIQNRGRASGWEDKEERRRRKREEGLQRQKERDKTSSSPASNGASNTASAHGAQDELEDGLVALGID
ncbi:hypothetical protein A1O1_08706 [Capronia coronata CBS 617.96]|uniref:tRNA(Phe) 7-[(3-amino-3-carboxypropyl)-4-demethylwyosine(37)-N(4)]-methyltransferase n=1 Tax=Capronia coronata CBS 617.96 TaxID=1182541 RepID=W9XT97_9EURO|nr:uncharacterized protein A1O1_08706 [Capronia coronata CBS 617.96]EXJ80560.1 hypothetical protein A1O1_08706 [Capronia coronata CBS 617.96]